MNFTQRGVYNFKLDAYLAQAQNNSQENILESYQKTLDVGSRVNEGADLPLDHAFMNELSGQTGGIRNAKANRHRNHTTEEKASRKNLEYTATYPATPSRLPRDPPRL